ncbi:hypothetical protein BT93_H1015 [Corymbia citriodora subsp. variegata]|nr:hypothetical protein BT93_H1015 [Corymbia citriodora subsp. variegata]
MMQGYMVGNGIADEKFDGNAFVPFAFGMGLISSDIYKACQITCGGRFYDPPSETCQKNIEKVGQAVSGLNMYDILEPCKSETRNKSGNTNMPLGFHQTEVNKKPLPKRASLFGQASPFWTTGDAGASSPALQDEYHVKCVDDEAAVAWLNDKAVRKAIHAAPVSVAGSWWICAGRVLMNYSVDTESMIPYHKNLTSLGYRVLIYSGDHDYAVPFTGTQAWTRSIGYKIIDEWRPWMTDDRVAGYLQGYDNNFTFLTIKGAGHMVPQSKPREALEFYRRWLDGKPI